VSIVLARYLDVKRVEVELLDIKRSPSYRTTQEIA